MKFSHKIEMCNLSPIRKFLPAQLKAEAAGKTVHHLNIGQPDIETPHAFFDAVRGFEQKVLDYAPSPGVPTYIEAVQEYYKTLGVTLDSGDILATYGGSEALQSLFSCILDDGDEVIVAEPFYPNYNTFIRLTGASIRPIPTTPEQGYHYATREQIEPLINEHTRAILISNPSNPTGVALTLAEQQLLVDIAREHNLFLIGDEVYRELIYDGVPMGTMLQFEGDNIVVIDSVSKRFSATGARVGALISRNQDLIGHALKICQGRLSSTTLDQIGAAALYRFMSPAYAQTIRDEYLRRRDATVEELGKIPGVIFSVPHGAFYIMAKLPVDDADKLQYFLLENFEDNQETVMYAPGEGFYATLGKGRNEIRIAYVLKSEEMRRSIQLLGMGIQAYQNRS